MDQNLIIRSALAGLLSLGIAGGTAVAADKMADKEKCYGVAKAGQNDCAAPGHACAGQSKADNDPQSFKMVANGTCAKMGGKMSAPKKS